jgi:hypothetical protein
MPKDRGFPQPDILMKVAIDVDEILNNIYFEKISMLYDVLDGDMDMIEDMIETESNIIVGFYVDFIDSALYIADKERVYDFLSQKSVARGLVFDRSVFDIFVDIREKAKENNSQLGSKPG